MCWNDLIHLFLIRMLVIELKKRLQRVKLCSTWNVGVWRWSSLIGGDTSLWNFKMVWYTTSKCYLMHEHVEIVIWKCVCSIISADMINHNKLSVFTTLYTRRKTLFKVGSLKGLDELWQILSMVLHVVQSFSCWTCIHVYKQYIINRQCINL